MKERNLVTESPVKIPKSKETPIRVPWGFLRALALVGLCGTAGYAGAEYNRQTKPVIVLGADFDEKGNWVPLTQDEETRRILIDLRDRWKLSGEKYDRIILSMLTQEKNMDRKITDLAQSEANHEAYTGYIKKKTVPTQTPQGE